MTTQTQRATGAGMAIVAAVALVIAVVVQPIGEWGTWEFILGAIVVLFLLMGLLAVVSKNPNLLYGGRDRKGRRTSLLIAAIFIAVALVMFVISGFVSGWTATPVLQVGMFGSLEVMMLGGLLGARAGTAP